MAVLIAVYDVQDPHAFADVFAEFESVRAAHGATGHRLFRRGAGNGFVVVIDFPSMRQAGAFASDPRRADALARATVIASRDILAEEVVG